MDAVVQFDLDLDRFHNSSSLEHDTFQGQTRRQLARSVTSPPAFHVFRLKTPPAQHPSLRRVTSTGDVLTQGARDREGRMDRSLDGQSASAVDVDAVSVRSIPGEFKEDFFGGHDAREVEQDEQGTGKGRGEAGGESGQVGGTSSQAKQPVLSAKQLGKLPASSLRHHSDEAGSGHDIEKMQEETQQPPWDRCALSQETTGEAAVSPEAGDSTKAKTCGSTGDQSQIFHPRPLNPVKPFPRGAIRNWETISAVLGCLPPPAFAACRTISQYGLGLDTNTTRLDADNDADRTGIAEEETERRVLRPAPLIEQGITFPRLYDPADMCTVLIGTRGFEETNMLASHMRLSGLKAAPDKWALLRMGAGDTSRDDPADNEGDFALARSMSLKSASSLMTMVHGENWTSCGMCVPRRLCVLLVEPRQGGEVLIQGLTVPGGSIGPLMRKLTLFFLGYDL